MFSQRKVEHWVWVSFITNKGEKTDLQAGNKDLNLVYDLEEVIFPFASCFNRQDPS